MSAQGPADDATQGTAFGWFGKLPGAGDFVSRRMSWRAQQHWDQWLSLGLEQLKAISTETGWGVWRNMPAWGFIVPAGQAGETPQLGLLVPSADRVGRLFPFLVAAPLTTAEVQRSLIAHAAPIVMGWYEVVSAAQRERLGVDLVDARLAQALATAEGMTIDAADSEVTLPPGATNHVLPWPDLPSNFDATGRESYWWSVPPASTGHRARTYQGSLTAAHFCTLST